MSLVTHFRNQLSGATRKKGEAYFRSGRVIVTSRKGDQLHAQVSGSRTRPYKVRIDWSDSADELFVECSCPHYEEGDFCKHIWATLLAAERDGALDVAGDGYEPRLVHRHDIEELHDNWDDEELVDEDDEPVIGMGANERLARGSRLVWLSDAIKGAKAPSGRLARSWHDELLRQPLSAAKDVSTPNLIDKSGSREREAWFVVDVAASAQAGSLLVALYCRERRKDGQWGVYKPLKARRDDLDQFNADDQRALGLALGNYTGTPYGYGPLEPFHNDSFQTSTHIEFVPAVFDAVLPKLCAAGRFGWALASDDLAEGVHPLTWDGDAPWQFQLAFDSAAAKKTWRVRGEFIRKEQTVSASEPVLVLASGLILFEDRLVRLGPINDERWLCLLRSHGELQVPHADRAQLLDELWAAGEPPTGSLPAALQLKVRRQPPRGVVQVHAAPDRKKLPAYHNRDDLYASVGFDYGELHAPLDEQRHTLVDAASNLAVVRDRAAENVLASRLAELQVRPKQRFFYYDPPGHVQFPRAKFAAIVSRLVDEGWRVEAEDRAIKSPGKMQATVTSGVDWFDLETAIDFGGVSASLPQLLAALQQNERFVELDDGSQGLLPAEWLERFAPLAELAMIDGDKLRFRPSQALLLDSLLADRQADVQVAVDRQFGRLRDKLRSFAGIEPREAPASFRGELRAYQKQGLGWLAFLAEFGLGGCLADDMGLGKTVQVLAWLVARRRSRRRNEEKRPTLVVCPKSVVFNWQLEAERFAPQLTVVNHTGLGRRANDDRLAAADLILTTYGTLRKDVETLKDVAYDYVILDEAQAIKNDQSVSSKACRLLEARHRLALTGTPVENRLGDLWSLFEFLNPGMLGRSRALQAFSRAASVPAGNGEQVAERDDQQRVEQTEAIGALRRGLAPFILRRTKEQVLSDLPEKSEQTMHVDLLPADRKRYNELRDHYRNTLLKRVSEAGINAARMHVLEALLRLRQTACHAGLVDKKLVGKPSAKIELLLEQIEDVVSEGHKALVFSQFTSLLAIVRGELDARGIVYEYLDGRTRNRQARVERFQSDAACPLFLISLKAGGTGLNLTAADYVFLLDPWWNPAVEAQAIDRAHRIGQQRRVFAYRLVARDTVEEKIIDLQRRKRELADAIISADGGALSSLSVEDLQALLS